jgi:hypothetical protein
MSESVITISVEEYERLKSAFTELVEKKEKETKKYAELRTKDTPENTKEKYKRYYEKHKEEISERRKIAREKKKKMKEEEVE